MSDTNMAEISFWKNKSFELERELSLHKNNVGDSKPVYAFRRKGFIHYTTCSEEYFLHLRNNPLFDTKTFVEVLYKG